jgi:hypothetical protein
VEDEELYPALTPIDINKYKLGRYAAFDVSSEPMFDREGLGEGIASAIDSMVQSISKSESAPRIFEVLQRWEARLFERGYHFLVSGGPNSWAQAGSQVRGGNVLAWQNANELWSVNVYGARRDKIVAALTREVPPTEFCETDDTSVDRTAKDAANKYKYIWAHDNKLQELIERIAGYQYTDERCCLYTRSVADAQRFGVAPKVKPTVFGEDQPEGVTPETEMDSGSVETDQPNIKELTDVWGVLEHRVPLLADDISEMGWLEGAHEIDIAMAKAKCPWIEKKITAGTSGKGTDQYDRMARMNTRLAVKNSTVSGESTQRETTEKFLWFRPSQYFDIQDMTVRAAMFLNFPDGLHVRHMGSDLAFVRNESMDKHCHIVHARPGTGQNRRAIGANYLPCQKALNTWVSLMNRFFVACVPHKYAAANKINIDAINQQQNDPSIITGVTVETGEDISNFFGIEPTPSPQQGMQEAITYFMDGLPEIMDGATPAVFGAEDSQTFGQAKLNKDAALQVFGTPWGAMCFGVAKAQEQAVVCAGDNRITDISSMVPGQGRLRIEIAQLRGGTQCFPKADSGFPESWAETEARVEAMVEAAANSPIYAAVLNYPKNALVLTRSSWRTSCSNLPLLQELISPRHLISLQHQRLPMLPRLRRS